MSDIKFTSDGKKVAVVGKLNNLETIVQEIFVTNGNEIPSGENFVVKSLHDAPVESWKEKQLREIEARYKKEMAYWQSLLDRDYRLYKLKTTELKAKIQYIGSALHKANEDSFSLLVDFICGEIKFVVIKNLYDLPKLLTWEEFSKDEMCEDKLKLISLYGKDDGTFMYKRGLYTDNSEGWSREIEFMPFKDENTALAKFKELFIASPIHDKSFEIAKKYGIKLEAEKVEAFKAKKKQSLNKLIDDHKQKIKDWEKAIKAIK